MKDPRPDAPSLEPHDSMFDRYLSEDSQREFLHTGVLKGIAETPNPTVMCFENEASPMQRMFGRGSMTISPHNWAEAYGDNAPEQPNEKPVG